MGDRDWFGGGGDRVVRDGVTHRVEARSYQPQGRAAVRVGMLAPSLAPAAPVLDGRAIVQGEVRRRTSVRSLGIEGLGGEHDPHIAPPLVRRPRRRVAHPLQSFASGGASDARAAAAARPAENVEEFLRWVYRVQRADVVVEGGHGLHALERALDGVERQGVSACGCVAVARVASVGGFVDGGGFDSGKLDPRAERAHEIARRTLEGPSLGRVIQYARAGHSQDGRPEIAKVVTVRLVAKTHRYTKQPVVIPGEGALGMGAHCPLVEEREAWAMRQAMAEWTAWRCAVVDLVDAFNEDGGLGRFELVDAPEKPWLTTCVES